MCFGNRNVLRTLSKVSNPLLVSQRDWVSADGAAFHTQPECTGPSCYRFPWHLECWHEQGVAGERQHHLHSHSMFYCGSWSLFFLHLSCVVQTFWEPRERGEIEWSIFLWDQELTEEGREEKATRIQSVFADATTLSGKLWGRNVFAALNVAIQTEHLLSVRLTNITK